MKQNLEASLSALIMSIASSAAISMGMTPDTDGNLQKDPMMARFHLDLLKILEEKTKNNLTSEEKKLLTQLITDLQLKYVELK